MTVSDKVWENEKGSGTRQEKPPPFYLCCHLVLTIHFPLFPLSLTLPSSVTLPISANCSFLILSPLTPQGSLSFPAFSSCFIYSLFNSLRCICFPFLSPWHPSPPLSHHLSLIHLFILPSSPCSPLGLSLSPSLCCICCISHTRWRHWVVYSYHLVGAFIFFTIHVLPSLSCKIFFSFNNLCSSFIVSLISPLDFLCFPLFDVESPFLLALSCFFFPC